MTMTKEHDGTKLNFEEDIYEYRQIKEWIPY